MKNNRQLYLLYIIQGVFLSLFSSCSIEDSIEVEHSFEAAINVEQSIEEFDQVQFKSFDNLDLGFHEGNVWIKLDITK